LDSNVVAGWLVGLTGGAMGSLAIYQAISGRPLYPFARRHTGWSTAELRSLGIAGAVGCIAVSVYGLLAAVSMDAHTYLPWGAWEGFPISALLL
jgi:hypothetical protein